MREREEKENELNCVVLWQKRRVGGGIYMCQRQIKTRGKYSLSGREKLKRMVDCGVGMFGFGRESRLSGTQWD